jgi:signal transduction histidine kinase
LATISSSASLITKYVDETTQANRVKHIDKIKSSVTHLTNILNDFLSISKLEEGKAQARLSECNIEDIAHDFLEEIKPLVTLNKSFIPEITLKEKILCTDPNILKNILFNLVSNAIKYTKQNGIITLKLYDDDQNLHLVVSDNGIGIPQKDQKHLFDRFFRAENASNLEGTGLGLFIVKKYSELLHGDISFTSTEITGTTFTLILPKIKPCINP